MILQGERNKGTGKFTTANGLIFERMRHSQLANMREIALWDFEQDRFFVAFFHRFLVCFLGACIGANDTILVGDRFPKTIEILRQEGYAVSAVPNEAVGRLDAGLSCMSLRWS